MNLHIHRLVSVAVLLNVTGCGIQIIQGDGDLETRRYHIESFATLINETPADMEVIAGVEPSIEITCDRNLLEYMRVESHRCELKIDTHSDDLPHGLVLLQPHTRCFATITTPAHRSCDESCAAATSCGTNTIVLRELLNEGSGDIDVHGVEADELVIAATGNGDVTVSGTATDVSIATSGDGCVLARELTAGDAEIIVEESGHVELTATGCVDVTIEGSGNVTLTGTPRICGLSGRGDGELFVGEGCL